MRTAAASIFSLSAALRRPPSLGDYALRWLVVTNCALLVAGLFALLHIGFDAASLLPKLGFAAMVFVVAAAYRLPALWLPQWRRPVAVVNDLLLSLVQLIAVISVLLPLTYLAATTGFPLLDDRLSHIDAAWFGFDWDAVSVWIQAHPLLDMLQQQAYGSLYWQGALVLLVGSVTRPGERNSEALWLFTISLIITIAIFCFTPALGRLGRSGDQQIVAMEMIRAGRFTVFSYGSAAGIISFPSFHSALALILTYCVRRQRPILAVVAPLNMFLLTAVPTVGGHYLIDVFAGLAVAGVSILLVRRMRSETFAFAIRIPNLSPKPADRRA